jgi:hypothetical protein
MRDTSPEAEAIALDAIRRRPPVERMREALELSETLRALALERWRRAYPADTVIQLVERMTGESLGLAARTGPKPHP